MNQCPVYGCHRTIADLQVVCAKHWEAAPGELRARVHAAKKERGSPAWTAAVKELVARLDEHEVWLKEVTAY
jgi:hypothetical protein